MLPLWFAVALMLLLTGSLGVINRKIGSGKAPQAPHDRGSSMLLGSAHSLSLLAGVTFPLLRIGAGSWSSSLAWLGVVVMPLAFSLQLWSMYTLRSFFTFTLAMSEHHVIVERGPYRVVRHPGYLAQILVWLAFGVATRDVASLLIIAFAVSVGYAYRIHREEQMLLTTLGDRYRDYARRTARLLPGLW